ncbi:MAG: dihydrodipicolinate synthase family protein [Chloroflexota bacterium]
MPDLKAADFKGIVPAIITPMTADGKLNEKAYRQVMEFNIQAGVHGFWVAGGTGESILLTDEENMRIAEIVADQNQGRIHNIMHVGASTTVRAARLAEHAAKVGVEAICCVPPFFYGQSDDAIVEHYRVVAEAANLPLFVYNLPQSTNVEITPALMSKIQEEVPQLTGLKHSAPYQGFVREFANMGLACFVGNCRLMLPAMTIGAVGCVDGPPNMVPERWVAIWEAYQAGDLAAAQVAQENASKVGDLVKPFRFHAIAKVVLSERLGIDCGAPRPPMEPLSAAERSDLMAALTKLELDPVEAPMVA